MVVAVSWVVLAAAVVVVDLVMVGVVLAVVVFVVVVVVLVSCRVCVYVRSLLKLELAGRGQTRRIHHDVIGANTK